MRTYLSETERKLKQKSCNLEKEKNICEKCISSFFYLCLRAKGDFY